MSHEIDPEQPRPYPTPIADHATIQNVHAGYSELYDQAIFGALEIEDYEVIIPAEGPLVLNPFSEDRLVVSFKMMPRLEVGNPWLKINVKQSLPDDPKWDYQENTYILDPQGEAMSSVTLAKEASPGEAADSEDFSFERASIVDTEFLQLLLEELHPSSVAEQNKLPFVQRLLNSLGIAKPAE